jgi:hypothetical protein
MPGKNFVTKKASIMAYEAISMNKEFENEPSCSLNAYYS